MRGWGWAKKAKVKGQKAKVKNGFGKGQQSVNIDQFNPKPAQNLNNAIYLIHF